MHLLGEKSFLFGKFRKGIARTLSAIPFVARFGTDGARVLVIYWASTIIGVIIVVHVESGRAGANGLHTCLKTISHTADIPRD